MITATASRPRGGQLMRHTTRWRRRTTAAALALTFGLAACGGTELQAETTASEGDGTDEERVEELEAQLAEARGDGGEGDASDADGTDDGTDGQTGETGEDAPVVLELEETRRTGSDQQLEVTVHRALVHEFWVEVELTVRHLGTDGRAAIWSSGGGRPLLYDEQDRRFEYRHPAGTNNVVRLEPGQTAEATMVFGGRVHPDAQQLTFGLDGWDIGNETFTFLLPEVGR
ncbi:hypothetical protein FTX61_03550 [Nitriliruptoraceae bacterium ZYF776]|nr:hypothetical protein [Profundirhabdus halotolerans]